MKFTDKRLSYNTIVIDNEKNAIKDDIREDVIFLSMTLA